MNSTLGSVVPLAMFDLYIMQNTFKLLWGNFFWGQIGGLSAKGGGPPNSADFFGQTSFLLRGEYPFGGKSAKQAPWIM